MSLRPRLSLANFLSTARQAVQAPAPSSHATQRQPPFTFVVGNESADLDSLCSAVVLAYLRTATPPYTLHIPLANLPRADLILRPELALVLRQASLQPSQLLTLSDLPGPETLRADHTRWLLVDHNALSGELAERFGRERVFGCVDHHDDEKYVPESVEEGTPRVVRKCGSCMSLVAEYGKPAWEALLKERERGEGAGTEEGAPQEEKNEANLDIDSQLAHLVIAPILVDTTNLQDENKTTQTDRDSLQFAEDVIKRGDGRGIGGRQGRYARKGYYDELMRVKRDVSGWNYRDVFRRDYKQWQERGFTLGVSCSVSLAELMESVGNKTQFLEELQKWAGEKKLDIVAVMTTFTREGVFGRELLVWALNESATDVVKKFMKKNEQTLGLHTWDGGDLDETETAGTWRQCWRQEKVENSRKQVAPMLREAMRASSGGIERETLCS